jgi:hypothetical protein
MVEKLLGAKILAEFALNKACQLVDYIIIRGVRVRVQGSGELGFRV